jgi:hypothetical protein
MPAGWSVSASRRVEFEHDHAVARKKAITLEEHLARICGLGGKAPHAESNDAEREEFARMGGKIGGKRRAEALSAAQRKAIAQKAAKAR